jgi:hypothetical protein
MRKICVVGATHPTAWVGKVFLRKTNLKRTKMEKHANDSTVSASWSR